MAAHKRKSYKYRKPAKHDAKTEARKARSMQTSWRHATGRTETLKIDDAKKLIDNPPTCPYCLKPIHWREFSVDHVQPRSRGGPDDPANLVWSCRRCNQAKGNLTGAEFKALLAFLNEHPLIRESVLPRLIAGGAAFGRRRRWRS